MSSSALEQRLREALAERPAPGELEAGRRTWPVVEAAVAERAPAKRRRTRPALRPVLAVGLLAAGLVAALSPAGATVGEWIEERVGLGPEAAQPTLAGFPRGGRLLAVSDSGAWVVDAGARLRRLGDYTEVGWSPRGLFVIGARGHRLTAMEPSGEPRWSLVRPGLVGRPAWSPGDGFRVAYLETGRRGTRLRVVDGSGRLDHPVAPGVAPVTPAWRPRSGYTLSYASRAPRPAAQAKSSGRGPGIVTVDADTGARLWSARTPGLPLELAWTRDGRRLAALFPGALRIYGRGGRLLGERRLAPEARARALALHPSGRRAALALSRGGVSHVLGISLTARLPAGRRLFTGTGAFTGLEWSPDGRRLLVSWPEANQWLLIGPGRPRAFAGVSRQLDPRGGGAGFPRLSGWCCPRR